MTILEVHGKYNGSSFPGRPAPTPIADARLYAVIVEIPEGNYFIKVTGPTATVEHHRKSLEAMVAGIQKAKKE